MPFVVEPLSPAIVRTYFRKRKFNILSIGKFFLERKNHLLLLKAVNELRQDYLVRLTMIASLNSENNPYYKNIRNYIAQKGLEDIVTLKINVPYRECLDEYLRHDLFVLPSMNEPAAVSSLEAMAFGLAIICTESDGARTYVQNNRNGLFFTSGNSNDLKNKIEYVISNRNLLKNMGKESARIVASDFSPERYYSELSKIIGNEFSR